MLFVLLFFHSFLPFENYIYFFLLFRNVFFPFSLHFSSDPFSRSFPNLSLHLTSGLFFSLPILSRSHQSLSPCSFLPHPPPLPYLPSFISLIILLSSSIYCFYLCFLYNYHFLFNFSLFLLFHFSLFVIFLIPSFSL